jgi:ribosomal protein L37AE/L43A
MSALFICPRCQATGLERRRGTEHDVFACRSCGAEYPLDAKPGPREAPTRRTAESARRGAEGQEG